MHKTLTMFNPVRARAFARIINLKFKIIMGFFSGLVETAFTPVRIVTKTADKVFNEDWEVEDALTLGATKVLKATSEQVDDIKDSFDDK